MYTTSYGNDLIYLYQNVLNALLKSIMFKCGLHMQKDDLYILVVTIDDHILMFFFPHMSNVIIVEIHDPFVSSYCPVYLIMGPLRF